MLRNMEVEVDAGAVGCWTVTSSSLPIRRCRVPTCAGRRSPRGAQSGFLVTADRAVRGWTGLRDGDLAGPESRCWCPHP